MKKITQFFSDTTYDCIPPQNSGMKLFVKLSYNKKLNKTYYAI